MAYLLLVHVLGEEPFLADAEELPNPTDNFLWFSNPRKRDGKPIPYIAREATEFFLPWHRVSIVEVMRGGEGEEEDKILEFFRD
ncbi:MAG: hypothetical protein JXA37_00455 [Chloroflexia bacterium]|nr:hypothetical protein [Chloroflexia bacterium]